jgi:hypothetical protein
VVRVSYGTAVMVALCALPMFMPAAPMEIQNMPSPALLRRRAGIDDDKMAPPAR